MSQKKPRSIILFLFKGKKVLISKLFSNPKLSHFSRRGKNKGGVAWKNKTRKKRKTKEKRAAILVFLTTFFSFFLSLSLPFHSLMFPLPLHKNNDFVPA